MVVVGFLVLLVVLLGSCASKPVVWDDSYPESEMTTVRFAAMTVTSYNGIGVQKWNTAKFPAGNTSIGADVNIQHGGITFKATGMEFSYRFDAEKEYQVWGATENMNWGVRIYDGLGSKREPLAFIPFKDQPVYK